MRKIEKGEEGNGEGEEFVEREGEAAEGAESGGRSNP